MRFQLKNEAFLPAASLHLRDTSGNSRQGINSPNISDTCILFLQKITPDASDFKDKGDKSFKGQNKGISPQIPPLKT